MVQLKACPKCRGDILLDRDMYGSYLKCLQCGSLKDIVEAYEQAGAEAESEQDRQAA